MKVFDCQVFNDLINSMDSSLNFPYTLYLRSNSVHVLYASDKCWMICPFVELDHGEEIALLFDDNNDES